MSESAIHKHETILADHKFQVQIDGITSRELTATNITTYAEDALDDLVEVVEQVTERYDQQPTIRGDNQQATERAAFAYHGLDADTISQTLDRIADVADSIRRLDALVASKTKHIDTVIVRTNPSRRREISPGDGSFESPKKLLPKLSTLLLLLEQGLDVDIESDDVGIESGVVLQNMMRKTSYDKVTIKPINRVVMTCDEVGARTFVFDLGYCENAGINLVGLTTSDYDDMIRRDPKIGQSLIYSKNYVNKLSAMLTNELDKQSVPEVGRDAKILREKPETAPDGVLHAHGIAVKNDVGDKVIKRIVTQLGETLGTVKTYRFPAKTTVGYDPQQIAMIEELIENVPAAPTHVLNVTNIAAKNGVSNSLVLRLIDQLGDSLGDTVQYRFRASIATGFLPEQVKIIESQMSSAPDAPEGVLTENGMARKLGVDRSLVTRIIKELGDSLGKGATYKFQGREAIGYLPAQVSMVEMWLQEVPEAPEGAMLFTQLVHEFKTSPATLQSAIDTLGDSIGELKRYRFRNRTTIGYLPDQIAMIKSCLDDAPEKPEGTLSVRGIHSEYNVPRKAIAKAISELGDTIGEVKRYRFNGKIAVGYNHDQIQLILNKVSELQQKRKLGVAAVSHMA